MAENIRELFDIMTFYKPINIVVEEQRRLHMSVLLFAAVVFVFWLISSVVSAFAFSSDLIGQLISRSAIFFLFFFGVLLQIPVSIIIIFIISRVFSTKGDPVQLLSINYLLAASSSLLVLVLLIPFAEFAGVVFFLIGSILYLYFLNEAFEKTFSIKHLQSIILMVIYIGVPALLGVIALFVTGQLKVLVI